MLADIADQKHAVIGVNAGKKLADLFVLERLDSSTK